MVLVASYYKGIKIKKIEYINGVYYADVGTSKEDHVSVKFKGKQVEKARCSCSGVFYECKHIEAVVAAIDDLKDKIIVPENSKEI